MGDIMPLVYAALAFGAAGFTFGVAACWHHFERERTYGKMVETEAGKILRALAGIALDVEKVTDYHAAGCPDGRWCGKDGSMSEDVMFKAHNLSYQLARDSRPVLAAAARLVVYASLAHKPKILAAAETLAASMMVILDTYANDGLPTDRRFIAWKDPGMFNKHYGVIADAIMEISAGSAAK